MAVNSVGRANSGDTSSLNVVLNWREEQQKMSFAQPPAPQAQGIDLTN
jgi:hypothetical protein